MCGVRCMKPTPLLPVDRPFSRIWSVYMELVLSFTASFGIWIRIYYNMKRKTDLKNILSMPERNLDYEYYDNKSRKYEI